MVLLASTAAVDAAFFYTMVFLFGAWVAAQVHRHLRRQALRKSAAEWRGRAAVYEAEGGRISAQLARDFAAHDEARAEELEP